MFIYSFTCNYKYEFYVLDLKTILIGINRDTSKGLAILKISQSLRKFQGFYYYSRAKKVKLYF